MSQIDVWAQSVLKNSVIPWICVLFASWTAIKYTLYVKNKLVKRSVQNSEFLYDLATRRHKLRLLSPLHYTVSSDWVLRNKGVIRIVDIGVCTGRNFKYFPNSSHVVVADSKYKLETYFAPVKCRYPTMHIEKCIPLNGDKLKELPDNFADAVVAFHVLCQANCVIELVREIHRILVPGGYYYFLEHILDHSDFRLAFLQKFLTVMKVWPSIYHGCHLDRNPEAIIKQVPFRNVQSELITFPLAPTGMLQFYKTHLSGCAIK